MRDLAWESRAKSDSLCRTEVALKTPGTGSGSAETKLVEPNIPFGDHRGARKLQTFQCPVRIPWTIYLSSGDGVEKAWLDQTGESEEPDDRSTGFFS